MHDTKKTLFHFTSILCSKDNHFLPCKIKINACWRCHVMSITITWKLSCIVNSEIWCSKILKLFRSWSNAPATKLVRYIVYTKNKLYSTQISWDLRSRHDNVLSYFVFYVHMILDWITLYINNISIDYHFVFLIHI